LINIPETVHDTDMFMSHDAIASRYYHFL